MGNYFFPYFTLHVKKWTLVSQVVSRVGLAASIPCLPYSELLNCPSSPASTWPWVRWLSPGQGDKSVLLYLMTHLACMKGGLVVSQTLAYTGLYLPAWGQPAQLGGIDSFELTAVCVGQVPREADSDLLSPWLCSLGLSSSLRNLLCPILTSSQLQLPAPPRALSLHFLNAEIISQVDQPVGPTVS